MIYRVEHKVGLLLFVWRINNNTRINSVFHVLTTVNLLLSHPVLDKVVLKLAF